MDEYILIIYKDESKKEIEKKIDLGDEPNIEQIKSNLWLLQIINYGIYIKLN